MSTNEEGGVQIATRIDRSLYAKILKRQSEAKRLTGIEPSISAIIRGMLQEATHNDAPKRRRHRQQ